MLSISKYKSYADIVRAVRDDSKQGTPDRRDIVYHFAMMVEIIASEEGKGPNLLELVDEQLADRLDFNLHILKYRAHKLVHTRFKQGVSGITSPLRGKSKKKG